MAKKQAQVIPAEPAIYVPPPLTDEEAFDRARSHRGDGGNYRDGFDGGSESPSDSDTIDPLVYPQADLPGYEKEWRNREARDDKRAAEVMAERQQVSREFRIAESMLTGKEEK